MTRGLPGTQATRLRPSCPVEPAASALCAHSVPSFLPPAALSDLRAVIPQPPEAPLSDGMKVPAVLPSLMIGIFLPLVKGASRRLPGDPLSEWNNFILLQKRIKEGLSGSYRPLEKANQITSIYAMGLVCVFPPSPGPGCGVGWARIEHPKGLAAGGGQRWPPLTSLSVPSGRLCISPTHQASRNEVLVRPPKSPVPVSGGSFQVPAAP